MTTRTPVTALVGAFVLVVSMGRCAPDVSNIACAVSENCPDGLSCLAGRCVASDGGASAGGGAGGVAGGASGGGAAGGLVAGGSSGGASGGLVAGGAGGGSSGGAAGGLVAGGDAGGAAGGLAGGSAGGAAGGGSGAGTGGGGSSTCVRDQDCGVISGCAAPRCQANGQCSTVPVDGGVICRASMGVCDVEERCSGASTLCPVNVLRTTVCSASSFACEGDAVCDGLLPSCPVKPLRDAGTVCLSPACLPPITCSGVSSVCTGPADAGQLCDDRNVCSVDTCAGGTSCTWAVEPSITSRALLNAFADAGVLRLALPRTTTTLTTPGGNFNLTLCPNDAQVTATPPECIVEVRLSGSTFVTTRSPTQFTGTGPASMRLQVLPWTVTGVSSGSAGSYLGVGGCSGPLPAMVQPANVPVSYGFRIDEGDGGLLTLLPFANIETDVASQVTTCQYLGFPNTLFPAFSSAVRGLVAASIRSAVDQAFTASMMEQLCLRPSDAGVCQYGTPANGLCMSGMSCFSARHFRNVVPTIPACVR